MIFVLMGKNDVTRIFIRGHGTFLYMYIILKCCIITFYFFFLLKIARERERCNLLNKSEAREKGVNASVCVCVCGGYNNERRVVIWYKREICRQLCVAFCANNVCD